MPKRKNVESHRDKKKRLKQNRLRKEHMYDYEKDYWKNKSSQATRQQKSNISNLFAGAGAAAGTSGSAYVAKTAVDMWGTIAPMLPAIEEAAGAEIMADMLVPVALGGSALAGPVAVGAAAGYILGEMVVDALSPTNSILTTMSGTYQGKFALSSKSAFKGLRDQYQKHGSCFIIENYGLVADPDLVYIGHSSWNAGCAVNAIGVALLRKLFRVGLKIDVKTTLEELPLVDYINPDSGPNGFVIAYQTIKSDGTITKYSHAIPNDSSLDTLLNRTENGFSLYTSIDECLTLADPGVLTKVQLYQRNTVALTDQLRLHCQLDMHQEKLTVAMSSHMVIQNRTKSSAGSSEITQVDAQPLKGPVFEFSIGCPKIKADTPIALNTMLSGGLILVRTGAFAGTDVTAYKEPPVRSLFQSVVKSGYVRLNPGALKSMTCGSDCSGYYAQVLFKLRYNSNGPVSRAYGKSQMVCLEEELNSGSANNITLSYECQHIAGASFTTTRNPNLQPGYAAANINNVPA